MDPKYLGLCNNTTLELPKGWARHQSMFVLRFRFLPNRFIDFDHDSILRKKSSCVYKCLHGALFIPGSASRGTPKVFLTKCRNSFQSNVPDLSRSQKAKSLTIVLSGLKKKELLSWEKKFWILKSIMKSWKLQPGSCFQEYSLRFFAAFSLCRTRNKISWSSSRPWPAGNTQAAFFLAEMPPSAIGCRSSIIKNPSKHHQSASYSIHTTKNTIEPLKFMAMPYCPQRTSAKSP